MKKTGTMNGTKTMNIKLRGYTPYGYMADINNQTIEFATESELEEYISGDNYESEYGVQVCIYRCDKLS